MDRKPAPDPVCVLRGSSSAVTVVKFAPKCVSSEGLLASGSSSGVISLWNLKTRRVQITLDAHANKSVVGLHITKSAKLISHGRDGAISIWDLSSSKPEATAKLPGPVLGFCKFTVLAGENFEWLAAAEQSEIMILDLKSNNLVCKMCPDNPKAYGMCMCVQLFTCPHTSRPQLLAGYENGSIALWDVNTRTILSHMASHTESVMCMDLDRVQLKSVTGSADNMLYITALESESRLSMKGEVSLKSAGTASVSVRGDSKLMVSGGWDGRILVYSWKSLKPLAVLNYHSSTINHLDFSDTLPARGMWMAAGSKDSRISLWDIYNDK